MARVLHLVTSSGVGGTELFLWQLLRRLDRRRFDPVVVSLKPPGEAARRIRELGVEVLSPGVGDERGAWGAFELLLAARSLPRLLGGRPVDLVHSFLFRAHIAGRLAARRLGARALVNSYRSGVEGHERRHLQADRWTARRVTRFHLQSAGLAAELAARLGISPARCVVIPNGIDLEEADAALAAARPGAREHLGLSRADRAILYLGRLHAEKGVAHLLSAFHLLLAEHPTARLVVAGEGPERHALEQAVEALRLRPFVRFAGAAASPWPLLAGADVLALPSLWEGMPNALLEAMAAGVPAVATHVGAVPEMVEDGREALLVPAADPRALAAALARLVGDPARARALGEAGRRRVEERFRIEETVAGIERLYTDLLGEAA